MTTLKRGKIINVHGIFKQNFQIWINDLNQVDELRLHIVHVRWISYFTFSNETLAILSSGFINSPSITKSFLPGIWKRIKYTFMILFSFLSLKKREIHKKYERLHNKGLKLISAVEHTPYEMEMYMYKNSIINHAHFCFLWSWTNYLFQT